MTIGLYLFHVFEVLGLLKSFSLLCHDEWWEVQAQLLRLAARLLAHLDFQESEEESPVQEVLQIVGRLFVVSSSKNVLQVA